MPAQPRPKTARDTDDEPQPRGLIVVNKPMGITSRRALDIVERQLDVGALGHCGSLDPLATGVLVLVVGKARKIQDMVVRSEKVYDITVTLGGTTETDDAEGELVPTEPAPEPPTREAVEAALLPFIGEIQQVPPVYSAVKVGGKRLHKEARKGNIIEPKPRTVNVHALSVTRYEWPQVDLSLRCGSGTYARSIARDLGAALGTGGYMSRLVRERVGDLDLDMARAPEDVTHEHIVGIEAALSVYPRLNVPLEQRHVLTRGQTLRTPPGFPTQEPCFAWVQGEVIAAITFVNGGTHFRTKRLLV
ncbi:MAG: tRNA pseudouridine(55) synthase TruB [Planctomycetota bacterium]|nr:MAG: tRNA pseudouridine(55) synthase TruB [Planctomycetota bacterium]